MHPKITEVMPRALIANVIRKEDGHVVCQDRILSEGT